MSYNAGPDQVSMQLDSEVQRLHHEVEALRLKDLQQEHHIHILTQQLRGSHPDPHQADTQVLPPNYLLCSRIGLPASA